MNLAEAINRIAKLGAAEQENRSFVTEHDGVDFLANGRGKFERLEMPKADTLVVHTLEAVRDYLGAEGDDIDLTRTFVHVVNARCVRVRGALRKQRDRETFLEARPIVGDSVGDMTDIWQEPDDFIVKLLSLFAPSAARDELLRAVGNLSAEEVKTAVDDGVTQQVVARTGVARVGNVEIRNPVLLVPLRTFPTINIGEVPFVVRFNKRSGDLPEVALFEADGGMWQQHAIGLIKVALLELGVDEMVEVIA